MEESKGFWYLGQPYTGQEQFRYKCGLSACAYLFHRGLAVYSPIVHWHPVAQAHHLPTNFTPWIEMNEAMMRASCGMIIYMLPGWEQSAGLAHEIEFCRKNKLRMVNLSATHQLDMGEYSSD